MFQNFDEKRKTKINEPQQQQKHMVNACMPFWLVWNIFGNDIGRMVVFRKHT